MYCTECGTLLTGGRFCGGCGSPVGPAPSAAQAVASPQPALQQAPWTPPPDAPAPTTTPAPAVAASQYPWDYARDLGAAAVLIWSLRLSWSYSAPASSVVYVLLTTLCALFSLAVLPLSRVLRNPDGSPFAWPTLAIRSVMCAPYIVVVIVAVVRDLAGTGFLGYSLLMGVFGVAIALVPREFELTRMADGLGVARRYRLACGWFGGAGLAAMVISTMVAVPPSQWFYSPSSFFLFVLPLFAVIGLFAAIYGVTALRIAAGRVSWQPTLVWLGVALLVAIVTASGGAAETSRSAFYGVWLLVVAAGLASAPLVGGRDGDKSQAAFWALVVANAFRVIVIGASIILALAVIVMIQFGKDGGTIPGELIWALISGAATVAAAAVGSHQLRQDPVRGRNTALICVGVMVLLRIIDLSVLGWDSIVSDGAPVSMMLLVGTFGVIVFGLTVPRPMRQAAMRPAATAGTVIAGPANAGGAIASTSPWVQHAPSAPSAPWSAPEADQVSVTGVWPSPPQFDAPDTEWSTIVTPPRVRPPAESSGAETPAGSDHMSVAGTTVADGSGTARLQSEPAHPQEVRPAAPGSLTKMAAPPAAPDPQTPGPQTLDPQPPDPQAGAAGDPATPLPDLMSIAASRPDLRPLIAQNPSTYPDLLQWLGQLGDPAIDAALARRVRR